MTKKIPNTASYIHDDHLGSGSLVTNWSATEVGGVSYDPWGRPRNRLDWDSYVADSSTEDIASGFTGHQPEVEHGLINMRGRMYDPLIGRFASVDPIISAPLSSQGWSPYSYVLNQPLSLVDPSGYSFGSSEPPADCTPFDDCWWTGPGPDHSGEATRLLRPPTEAGLYRSMFGTGAAFGFNAFGSGGGGLAGIAAPLSSGGIGSTSAGVGVASVPVPGLLALAPAAGGDACDSASPGSVLGATCAAAKAMVTKDNPQAPATAAHVEKAIREGKTRKIGEAGAYVTAAILSAGSVWLSAGAAPAVLSAARRAWFWVLSAGPPALQGGPRCNSARNGCGAASQTGVRASSRALGRALKAAKHVRAPGNAAHHIVAGNARAAAAARAVLARFGIRINEAANGVFLPATKASPNPTGAAVHSSLHTRAYYQAVNDALSQVTTRGEALEALAALRSALLGGGL